MNRTLIVEDDPIQLENLRRALHKTYPTMQLTTAKSYELALVEIKKSLSEDYPFTLFLLDIQLTVDSSNRGGFKIADYLRKFECYYTTPILFLTLIRSDIQHAINSYHCYNYITKPYSSEDVITELKHMTLTGILREHSLLVTDIYGIQHHILPQKIIFIHVQSHTLFLHTEQGVVETRDYSLSSIQKILDNTFIKCHKSYLLNLHYIINYDKTNHCVNIQKQTIPVSRTYSVNLQLALEQYTISEGQS